MLTDPLGDMITRIRNGLQAGNKIVELPYSKLRKSIIDLLIREGFVNGVSEKEVAKGIKTLTIDLKYFDNRPGIKEINRISKPGRRIYSGKDNMPKVYNGLGVAVLSTSKGLMTDHEARLHNIGGEILFTVF